MATLTKKQARLRGITQGHICRFHLANPDQQGITESCKNCKIIRDPCGCDEDSSCEDCDAYKEERQQAVKDFISKLFTNEAIEAEPPEHPAPTSSSLTDEEIRKMLDGLTFDEYSDINAIINKAYQLGQKQMKVYKGQYGLFWIEPDSACVDMLIENYGNEDDSKLDANSLKIKKFVNLIRQRGREEAVKEFCEKLLKTPTTLNNEYKNAVLIAIKEARDGK